MDENRAGNCREALHTEVAKAKGLASNHFRNMSHKIPEILIVTNPLTPFCKFPNTMGANPKLNLFEATSTSIEFRRKKSKPQMIGEDPPFNTLIS
jgi:hypothetical protein